VYVCTNMSPHSKNCLKKTASLVTHHSNVTTRCLQTTRGLHQNLSTEPLILPLQEIYPPKVTEFAYVTDGACDVATILDTELVICKVLNWRLNHHTITINTWVNVYMQLCSHHLRPPGVKAKEFEYPAYSSVEFIRVMQVQK